MQNQSFMSNWASHYLKPMDLVRRGSGMVDLYGDSFRILSHPQGSVFRLFLAALKANSVAGLDASVAKGLPLQDRQQRGSKTSAASAAWPMRLFSLLAAQEIIHKNQCVVFGPVNPSHTRNRTWCSLNGYLQQRCGAAAPAGGIKLVTGYSGMTYEEQQY